MRIVLVESEILMALEDFVLNTLKVPDDIRVDIDLKATRGEEGHTAIIDLVHLTSPADGSDRSVDDRIVATDEAKAEGLGIVDKIEAARAEAKAPRRRGRPPGSKNLPKVVEAVTGDRLLDVVDGSAETKTDLEPEAVTEAQAAVAEEVAAPVEERDANVSASNEELVAQAEANAPLELESEPVQETGPVEEKPEPQAEAAEPAQPKRSLFGGLSNTKTDDGPAPVEEVEAIQDEPEPNSEAALAAEAAATEPAETVEDEDVDYTPTPETAGLETEVAEGRDETPAPAPTRSLFADLKRPTN